MKNKVTVFDNVKTAVKALIYFKNNAANIVNRKIEHTQQYIFNMLIYTCLMGIVACTSWILLLAILFKLLENVHITMLASFCLLLIFNMIIFIKIYFSFRKHMVVFNTPKKQRIKS